MEGSGGVRLPNPGAPQKAQKRSGRQEGTKGLIGSGNSWQQSRQGPSPKARAQIQGWEQVQLPVGRGGGQEPVCADEKGF